MDLLGRKAKRLLEEVVTRAEQLEAQRDEALRLAYSQGSTLSELSRRLDSREGLVRDLFLEREQLIAEVRALSTVKVSPPSRNGTKPVYMSEEEQELKFQLDNRLIDTTEYEHLLQELDFQNADIALDPDYTPRPDLTY